MDFFYRERPWYAGQFVRKIIPKIELKKGAIQFFTVSLNTQKKKLLSGLVREVDNTFLNGKIQLPTKNKKIDFDFMESFITELETERISKLETYLEQSGLKDYSLTPEEQKALDDFESGKIIFKEFKIDTQFKVESYKKRFDANKVKVLDNGKFPYIVRQGSDNGQKGYIDEDIQYLNDGNTISFGQDTATMYYQEKPYFTGDKIKIVKPKNSEFNKKNALFFITTMRKSFSSFTWGGSSFNVDIINNQAMNLAVTNNQPDYKLMETLISAIQKQVIKDVVLYTDKKLGKSK
jgi:hypothetical protein